MRTLRRSSMYVLVLLSLVGVAVACWAAGPSVARVAVRPVAAPRCDLGPHFNVIDPRRPGGVPLPKGAWIKSKGGPVTIPVTVGVYNAGPAVAPKTAAMIRVSVNGASVANAEVPIAPLSAGRSDDRTYAVTCQDQISKVHAEVTADTHGEATERNEGNNSGSFDFTVEIIK